MKITSETSDLMILKDYSVFIFLTGLAFGGAGIFYFVTTRDFSFGNNSIISLINTCVGLALIGISKITTVTIDLYAKNINYTWLSIFGKKTRDISTGDIKSLDLREVSNNRRPYFALVFMLTHGEDVPLVEQGSRARFFGSPDVPERRLGKKVADFLRIPFEERRPPTMHEILSVMKMGFGMSKEKYEREHASANQEQAQELKSPPQSE